MGVCVLFTPYTEFLVWVYVFCLLRILSFWCGCMCFVYYVGFQFLKYALNSVVIRDVDKIMFVCDVALSKLNNDNTLIHLFHP